MTNPAGQISPVCITLYASGLYASSRKSSWLKAPVQSVEPRIKMRYIEPGAHGFFIDPGKIAVFERFRRQAQDHSQPDRLRDFFNAAATQLAPDGICDPLDARQLFRNNMHIHADWALLCSAGHRILSSIYENKKHPYLHCVIVLLRNGDGSREQSS
jgi:hypothetical protein